MDELSDLYTLFEKCSGVTTDSRRIEPDSMFFALHGASFDGNAFAADAITRGARIAVVDSDEPMRKNPELADRMVRVEDTLKALQSLAREHRRQLAIPIIAIVGSNGKTTTKELVACVLAEKFAVTATQGNLNNHIGVPLTLLSMNGDTRFGVVEMGASACGEIALLASIAEPNYGIITNIGRSHLEGFGGVEGIRRGKGELFDFLAANGGTAFVPQENLTLTEMAAERPDMAAERYSTSIADGVKSNLEGDYNRLNIAAAVEVGTYFGIARERIEAAIAEYVPSNNRSQRVESGRNSIIVDCYNANPSSMAAAIDNMKRDSHKPKLLILGDMLELGEWSAAEHRSIAAAALAIEGAEIVSAGGEFARAAAECDSDGRWKTFATTDEIALYLRQQQPAGYKILIKGSHKWSLEKLVELL
ncbi:MAG: UDP-N-acetylmuramoyl-tripeptide--D-alanyl-D-alanine ligase [Alistipes sp.]|nr:UDP-N-acetylmuramoyl-tripeptide--D-alanyl-D-alanine ligase [Alistipes sp.]